MNKKSVEHYEGCLLGVAVGDALGAPVEFFKLNKIRELFGPDGVTGYIEFGDGAGEFTDDTQMTLFTAEGILRAARRSLIMGTGSDETEAVYRSYLRWLHTQHAEKPDDNNNNGRGEGGDGENGHAGKDGWLIKERLLYARRAPGNTCLGALKSGRMGAPGHRLNDSKGCGGAMRVAPAGLVYFGDDEKAFEMGARFAAITHSHPSGYLSAGVYSAIIAGLAHGEELSAAVERSLNILKKWNGHEETLWAAERAVNWSASEPAAPETLEKLGGGWVGEEALAISIFCALKFTDDFRGGVLLSVNHGGDSDSTGSITGGMLGLINGRGAIPAEWIEKLRGRNIVETVARDLHALYGNNSIKREEERLKKYPPSF